MASLITRPRSPFWYLQHKKDGKWLKTSTGLRCDCPNDTAKARALRAEFEAHEFSTVSAKASNWEWVPDYLENMGSAPRTLICYHSRWRWVGMFFTQHKIASSAESVGELRLWKCPKIMIESDFQRRKSA